MPALPNFFRLWLSRSIWKHQAQQIWDYLQSNADVVVHDDLEKAIRERRDWSGKDEDD